MTVAKNKVMPNQLQYDATECYQWLWLFSSTRYQYFSCTHTWRPQ